MSPTPILSFLVNIRASSILLKRPVVAEHVVSKFEYHSKYLLYVPLMINCSLLENYQRGQPFGTCSEPDHKFFRKFLYLLNATFRIRVGTTWRPDPLILEVINSINVEHFFFRKQKCQSVLFTKVCSYPICKFKSFCFLVFRNFWLNFYSVRF